jgi:lipid II:glycine glycyltransferase (peptidoglycan interpeptide bridge formation enzyme)
LGLLVLLRPLAGGFSLAYAPAAPDPALVSPGGWEALEGLSRALAAALPRRVLFIRWDLPWEVSREEQDRRPRGPVFFRAPVDIQPPSTVMLDLSGEEEAILGGMKKRGRANIRVSEKRGVEIRRGGPEDITLWYRLYQETARRDRIAIHGEEYYRRLLSLPAAPGGPEIRLYLARVEGCDVGGIITSFTRRRGVYLYGASSSSFRSAMPAYGLQWQAIKDARRWGCAGYDLYGIPPAPDPEHPMAGLYLFKTGFGGRILHRPGSYDYPLRPGLYRLDRLAEALRGWYFKKFKKRR